MLSYVRGAGQGGGVPRWLRQDGTFETDCPGGPCELGELTSQEGLFANPALSPDERRIAFEFRLLGAARNDIWILDIETGTYAPLTFEGNNARPIWSPDGDEVGFVSDRGGAFAFYSRPSNFGDEPRLILEAPAGGEILDAVWTPDGQSLVYRQTSERQADTPEFLRNSDILQVALDPRSDPFPVAATPFTEGSPSISPDGRWVAFSSDVSGRREVFVAPLDGSGGRIPVSVNGGSVPVWTADGTGIFYERSDVNNVIWLVADVRTDPDFAVVGRRELMSNANFMPSLQVHANYDVTADGQHLVVISVGRFTDAGSRPVIVTNWFEELRERLGN